MSFAATAKNRELAFITRLLSIFGVVEERQLRELFSYMDDRKYGSIMTRLHLEGMVYRTPDAQHIASSQFTLSKTNVESSVMCFWAFIEIKNKVLDFCAAERPAVMTVSTKKTTYDLIPVSTQTVEQINEAVEAIPEDAVRFLITADLQNITQVERRIKNDFVLLVGEGGVTASYEL